jgi:hypothetical protein
MICRQLPGSLIGSYCVKAFRVTNARLEYLDITNRRANALFLIFMLLWHDQRSMYLFHQTAFAAMHAKIVPHLMLYGYYVRR